MKVRWTMERKDQGDSQPRPSGHYHSFATRKHILPFLIFISRSLSRPLGLLRTLAYACHGLPCSLCTLTAHLSTYLPTRTAMVNTFLCFSYTSFQTYPTTPISRSPAPILHSLALATHSSSSSSRLNSFRSLSSSPVSLFVNVNKVPLTPQIRLSPVSYRP
jgi:hypothetical protein